MVSISAMPTLPSGTTGAELGLFLEGAALQTSRFGCADFAIWRYRGGVGSFSRGRSPPDLPRWLCRLRRLALPELG